MRRLFCGILALLLCVGIIPAGTFVFAEESAREITLSMHCNISSKNRITGFYKENGFYVDVDTLCEISGAKVEQENKDTVHLSTSKGIRSFLISFSKRTLTEKESDSCVIKMPCVEIDGVKCISVLHFLRYLGADVCLDNSKTQLKIYIPYTIYDALADYVDSNLANYFWWDQVDYEGKSMEDKLINAGVVALINKDCNIFRMMFDAEGIQREAIEDALLSIIQNEGQNSIKEESQLQTLNSVNQFYSAETDIASFVVEILKNDGSAQLGEFIDKFGSISSFASSRIVDVLNAVESFKQYDNISQIQISLLQNTILEYKNDSATLRKDLNVVFDAAKNVSRRVEDAYANAYAATMDTFDSTARDVINGVLELKDPIVMAWEASVAVMKLIPFTADMIDRKTQLYNGYNCSMIQLIANELLVKAYTDLYENDYFPNYTSLQRERMEQVKNSLILQYKSTLTTREYLISSQFLTEELAQDMHKMNQQTACLLNKLENARLVPKGIAPTVEEDLRWLESVESAPEDSTGNGNEGKLQLLSEYEYGPDGKIREIIKYDYNDRGLVQNSTTWILNSFSGEEFFSVSQTVSYRYDEKNNLIEEITRSDYGETEIDYEYNQSGKMRHAYWRHSGNHTEYQYNSNGQLVCEIQYDATNDIASLTKYEYDYVGNLVKWESGYMYNDEFEVVEGETHVYDENGHLMSDEDHTYKYDDAWNLIYEEETYGDMHFATKYEYDQKNRLVLRTENSSGMEMITEYAYDQYGNIILQKTTDDWRGESSRVYNYGTICTFDTDTPWKEAYAAYLQTELHYTSKEEEFYLIDIDGDSIPELIIESPIYADGSEICSFDGTKVNNMYLRGWGSISYIPGENYVLNESGHHGIFQDDVYRVADGRITQVASGIWSDTGELERSWNDKEVSEDSYNRNLQEIFDTSSAIYLSFVGLDADGKHVVGNNVYSYSQIISILTEGNA